MAQDPAKSLPWVADETVGGVLGRTAGLYPDRDALVFPGLGLRWSWRELDERVDRIASSLIGLGVGRGEHVGIWSMNVPEWVVTQFAAGRIGAVLVNVNPAYRLHELKDALAMADVATLIVGAPFKGSNFVAMVESLCPEVAAATSRDWSSARFPLLEAADRPGRPPRARLVDLVRAGSGRRGLAGRAGATAPGPPRPATSTTSSSPRGRPACPRARCSRTGTCS